MKGMPGLLLAILLAGCCTTVERTKPLDVTYGTSSLDMTSLCEALLARTGTTVQSLAGSWKDHPFAAEVVMKGDGETLTVVFLAPQMRLATMTLTKPHALAFERAPQIPRMFEPEYALADLAFINLDVEALRRAGGGTLSVTEKDGVRHILVGGTPVAELVWKEDGTRTYRNLAFDYAYTLTEGP